MPDPQKPVIASPPANEPLHALIEKVLYGGSGLGRPLDPAGRTSSVLVPFTLAGERVGVLPSSGSQEAILQKVLQPSPHRVTPGCPHFGVCGGCHLQMGSYPEQLRVKREVLLDALRRAGVRDPPEPEVHSSEPWGYRNRIRLRLEPAGDSFRFGYTRHGSAPPSASTFLPIVICPIAAPLLWRAAEAVLAAATDNPELARWLVVTKEVEFFANADLSQLGITFLCTTAPSTETKISAATRFERAMGSLRGSLPELHAASAVQATWRPLRLGQTLATFGPAGLAYVVNEERYWVAPGGFFQVNRFLLPALVGLVEGAALAGASPAQSLAWDLFAGVGLFSRVLARHFRRVTAVEAHPGAARELGSALGRLNRKGELPQYVAENCTTLAFLQAAVPQRERPDLILLDPPRAGAGEDSCRLLLRLAAPELVYISCDPVTLARDLVILQAAYSLSSLHLVDLFPQTYHQEAVVTLRLRA